MRTIRLLSSNSKADVHLARSPCYHTVAAMRTLHAITVPRPSVEYLNERARDSHKRVNVKRLSSRLRINSDALSEPGDALGR